MHYGTGCGAGCLTTVIAGCVVWGAVASALLYFTWNHVVADIFSRKKVRFTQALLVVATLCVFCLPASRGKHGGWAGRHCKDGSCETGRKRGDCGDCDKRAGACKHGDCDKGDCAHGDCKDCDHKRAGGKGPCPYEREGGEAAPADAKK